MAHVSTLDRGERARRGWRRAVGRTVAAMAVWSLLALTLLVFFPFKRPVVPCARLVGTPETRPACQLVLDAANEQAYAFQTLPMLVAIATGYLVIAVIETRRYRRGASLTEPAPARASRRPGQPSR